MSSQVDHVKNRIKCGEILKEIEKTFLVNLKSRNKSNVFAKRIYSYVCRNLGYSFPEMSVPLKKAHTTLMHHYREIKEHEIKKAQEFINKFSEEKEDIQIIVKDTIYERTGFRYDGGKKECSTNWKRFYPLKQPYRGI